MSQVKGVAIDVFKAEDASAKKVPFSQNFQCYRDATYNTGCGVQKLSKGSLVETYPRCWFVDWMSCGVEVLWCYRPRPRYCCVGK